MWWELVNIDRQYLSDLAGSASFVIWLFAQSPQLYENYRNSSCDGLSIVFLVQWMAGDVTNLVGCLLTQQLPFQIAIASYFCSIDLCILAQYYHYWRRDRHLSRGSITNERRRAFTRYSSFTAPNMRSSSTQPSLFRADQGGSMSPSASIYRGTSKAGRPGLHYSSYSHDSSCSYKALSQTARSVADLANEYARRVAKRDANRQARWSSGKAKGKGFKSGTRDGGEEEGAPANLQDSILSDSSNLSDDFGYGFGTASTVLEPVLNERVPSHPSSEDRGRDMTRMAGKVMGISSSRSPRDGGVSVKVETSVEQADQLQTQGVTAVPLTSSTTIEGDAARYPRRKASNSLASRPSGSRRSTRSPTASRGTSIVLLGITALFGLSNWSPSPATHSLASSYRNDRVYVSPVWTNIRPVESMTSTSASSTSLHYYSPHQQFRHQYYHNHQPPTWERIVGRISAWICTVLYMTSRLPQIWTNLSRKSVQGLSILLFMAAALGNALYSISILVNPLASGHTRYDYILESLPFLLGSGGTLLFDAIIVMQWILWRGKAPTIVGMATHSSHTSTLPYRSESRTSRQAVSAQRWSSLERQPLLE